jgi:hypothetical protein
MIGYRKLNRHQNFGLNIINHWYHLFFLLFFLLKLDFFFFHFHDRDDDFLLNLIFCENHELDLKIKKNF